MALVTWRNLPPFIWKTFKRLARRKEPKVHSERGRGQTFVSEQEYNEALLKKNLTLRWETGVPCPACLSCHVFSLQQGAVPGRH